MVLKVLNEWNKSGFKTPTIRCLRPFVVFANCPNILKLTCANHSLSNRNVTLPAVYKEHIPLGFLETPNTRSLFAKGTVGAQLLMET